MTLQSNTLSDTIQGQIDYTINKLPVNQQCKIIKTYEGNYADLQIENTNRILTYVQIIGDNTVGSTALLVFLDNDYNQYLAVTDNEQANINNTILALGLGLFTIREDGHLWVELPMGLDNPFYINGEGHLIVTLPEGMENDYEIIDKHLIYHRGG